MQLVSLFDKEHADRLFDAVMHSVKWLSPEQTALTYNGRMVNIPRMQAVYATQPGRAHAFSNKVLEATCPMPECIKEITDTVNRAYNETYNFALINRRVRGRIEIMYVYMRFCPDMMME